MPRVSRGHEWHFGRSRTAGHGGQGCPRHCRNTARRPSAPTPALAGGAGDHRPPPDCLCCLWVGSLPGRRESEMRVQAEDFAHIKKKRQINGQGCKPGRCGLASLGMVTFSSSISFTSYTRQGCSCSLGGGQTDGKIQLSTRGAQKMVRDAAGGGQLPSGALQQEHGPSSSARAST